MKTTVMNQSFNSRQIRNGYALAPNSSLMRLGNDCFKAASLWHAMNERATTIPPITPSPDCLAMCLPSSPHNLRCDTCLIWFLSLRGTRVITGSNR